MATLGTIPDSLMLAASRSSPPSPEEQRLLDAEKERIWAAIMADSQR